MRRAGFTLIELLVTIGILAALIAILTPALRKSRLQARATVCASNVKQLSLALFTYVNDNGRFPCGFYNDGNTPVPEEILAGGSYDRTGWWWFNYIEGLYTRSIGPRTILLCPSKQIRTPKFDKNVLCGNYGANLSICKMSAGRTSQKEFVGEPSTGTEVKHSSRTLLLLDSGYAIISWHHATDTPPVPLNSSIIEDTAYVPGLKINKGRLFWSNPGGVQEYDAIYGRHPRKTVNVGYMDGHVARIEADDLLVEKTDNGYKNLVPLWRPK